jgi:hypothetical protein
MHKPAAEHLKKYAKVWAEDLDCPPENLMIGKYFVDLDTENEA